VVPAQPLVSYGKLAHSPPLANLQKSCSFAMPSPRSSLLSERACRLQFASISAIAYLAPSPEPRGSVGKKLPRSSIPLHFDVTFGLPYRLIQWGCLCFHSGNTFATQFGSFASVQVLL
jgi:hypothetical protein